MRHPDWCDPTKCHVDDAGTPDQITGHVLDLATLTLTEWSGPTVGHKLTVTTTWDELHDEDGDILTDIDAVTADLARARAWALDRSRGGGAE